MRCWAVLLNNRRCDADVSSLRALVSGQLVSGLRGLCGRRFWRAASYLRYNQGCEGSFDSGVDQITTVVRTKLAVDADELTVSAGGHCALRPFRPIYHPPSKGHAFPLGTRLQSVSMPRPCQLCGQTASLQGSL